MRRTAAGLAALAVVSSGLAFAAGAPASAAPETETTVSGTVVVEDAVAGYEGGIVNVTLDGWKDGTWQYVAADFVYAYDGQQDGDTWQITVPADADYDAYALSATPELSGYAMADGGPGSMLPVDGSSDGAFTVTDGQDTDRGPVTLVPQDGTRWVTGTAQGPGGSPLSGVDVAFARWEGEGDAAWPADDGWYGAFMASSSEDGSFVAPLPAGTYHATYTARVDCLAPYEAPDVLTVPGSSAGVDQPIALDEVTLESAHHCAALTGSVSSNHALPTGATLYRWDESVQGWGWADYAAVAADGTYSFQVGVPDDDTASDHYTVEFDLPNSYGDAWLGGGAQPGSADADGATVAVAHADADEVVNLPDTSITVAPVAVYGEVDEYGDPGYTANGTVSLYQWNGAAFVQLGEPQSVTQSQPQYRFPDVDPTTAYYLAFHSTNPSAEDQYSNNAPVAPTSLDDDAVVYPYWYQAGQDVEVDLYARAPWRLVSGTVTDEDGEALPNMLVEGSSPNMSDDAMTDDEGHWQMRLTVGSSNIVYAADQATCFAATSKSQEVSLTVPRATGLDVGVQKLAAETTCTTLAGTLKNGDGDEDVTLYHLVTHHEDEGDGESYDWPSADWQGYTWADEDGGYSFPYARPGQRYVVHSDEERTNNAGDPIIWSANLGAPAAWTNLSEAPGLTLPADAGTTYPLEDLVLAPTATVKGSAKLADGSRPAYWVWVLQWNAEEKSFDYFDGGYSDWSDEDGSFVVEGLPTGTYTLEFDPDDYASFDDTYLGGGDSLPSGPGDTGHVFTVGSSDIGNAITVGSTTLRPADGQPVPTPTGDLTGSVVTAADSAPVAGAYVTACAVSGSGVCGYSTRTAADGSYEIDGLPVGDYVLDVASPTPDTLFGASGTASVTADERTEVPAFALRAPKIAPTSANVSLINAPATGGGATAPEVQPTTFGGVPSFYYDDPVNFSISGCATAYGDLDGDHEADAAPAYELTRTDGSVISSGPLTAGDTTDGVAAFTAKLGKLYPNHGGATITTNILATCDGDAAPVTFDVFIDPSGVVTDQYGRTLSGASVTLLKGDGSDEDSYLPVPDKNVGLDSPVMSPANTANPTITDGSGYFRWDVTAGTYEIEAVATGCESSTTDSMSVPPLQIDLVLPLQCDSTVAPAPEATGAPSLTGDGTVGSTLTLSAGDVSWPAPLESAGLRLYRDYGTADEELVADCDGQSTCAYQVSSEDAGHDLTVVAVGQRPDYVSPTGLAATFDSVEQAGRTVSATQVVTPPSGGGDTGTTPPPSTGGDTGTTPPPSDGGDTGTTPPPSTGGDTGTTPPPSSGGSKPTVKGSTGISGHVVPGHKLTAKLPAFKGLPAKAHKQVVWFVNGKKVGTGRHLKVKAAWVGKKVVAKVTATWTEKVNGLKVTKHLSRASKPVRVRRG